MQKKRHVSASSTTSNRLMKMVSFVRILMVNEFLSIKPLFMLHPICPPPAGAQGVDCIGVKLRNVL